MQVARSWCTASSHLRDSTLLDVHGLTLTFRLFSAGKTLPAPGLRPFKNSGTNTNRKRKPPTNECKFAVDNHRVLQLSGIPEKVLDLSPSLAVTLVYESTNVDSPLTSFLR
jgi:hypothetical protein